MTDQGGGRFVTRRDFYSALSIIWLYIFLVIGELLREDSRWTKWVLWAVSAVSMLMYAVLAYRSRGTRESE
jgi:hypothetical protein